MTALDANPLETAVGGCRTDGWVEVCELQRLTSDRGVAALVDHHQVAVFRLSDDTLHAVDHAAVLSRGIVGDAAAAATIASPLYKQRFELATGRCLDAAVPALGVHDIAVIHGVIYVRLRSAP